MLPKLSDTAARTTRPEHPRRPPACSARHPPKGLNVEYNKQQRVRPHGRAPCPQHRTEHNCSTIYSTGTASQHHTPFSVLPNSAPFSANPTASTFSTTGVFPFQRTADCQAFRASACIWTAWRDILLISPLAKIFSRAAVVVPWYRNRGGGNISSSGCTHGIE